MSLKTYTTTAEKAAAASKLVNSASLGVGSGVAGTPTAVRPSVTSSGYDSIMNVTRATHEASKANTALTSSTNDATNAAKKLRDEQKQLNHIMHEGHSAARGLAQGFGAMVFTYGSIVPLLAGAAISNALVQTVKEGAALERHLTFVSELAGGAAVSMHAFEEAMRGSQVSVNEGALGLRALAQSGFDAQQSLIALPEILKLATVGEMSMGQAALSASGIMHAFNLSLGDMSHIVDVLTKSAAASNTSVASITESMKTASVVADQYNLSLETTVAALEILGKRNIIGTAGGTAFKNLVSELAAPTSKKAIETLQQLGFTAYDVATKQLKPFEQQLKELRDLTANLDDQSFNRVLGDVTNERSRKAFAALLKDYDDFIKRIATAKNAADRFSEKVNEALSKGVAGQMKTLANDMEMILGAAFNNTADAWSNLVGELSDFVKSDGFKGFIDAVSGSVIFLAQNIELAGVAVAAFAARTQIAAAASAAASVYAAESIAVGMMGTAAATSSVTLATTALGAAFSAVFWPVAILAAVTGAYFYFKDSVDKSAEAHDRFMRESDGVVERLNKLTREAAQSAEAYREAARTGEAYADVLARIRNGGATADLTETKALMDARDAYLKAKSDNSGMGALRPGNWAAEGEALKKLTEASQRYQEAVVKAAEGAAASAAYEGKKTEEERAKEFNSLRTGTDKLIREIGVRRGAVTGYADSSQALWMEIYDLQTAISNANPDDKLETDKLKFRLDEATSAANKMKSSMVSMGDGGSKATTKVLDHTKELTAQINLLKLEQMNADKEFANVDSMNKRNQALRGYATEAETAATYMQALSKIESQYTIDAINAEKAVVSAEDSLKKLRGASKPDASAIAEAERMLESAWGTYEATMSELDAKEGIARVAALILKSDTDRASTAKIVLDQVNKEKAARDFIEVQYQDKAKLARAQNNLDMIGKNLTVSQVAEMERLAEVEAARHELTRSSLEAEITLETELQRLLNSGATDITQGWDKAYEKLDADLEAAKQKFNTAVSSSGIAAATKVRTEYQKTFDRIETGLTDALMKGGKEGAQQVRDLIVKELAMEPFQIVVRALLQPVTQGLTNAAVSSVGGSAAGSAGGSLLGNAVGSLAGAQAGAALSTGSGLIGQFASGFSGSASTAASLMGAEMTTAASLGSMVAAALPWAAGAMLIASLAGGETRSGAQYSNLGVTGAVNYTEGPSGGEIASEAARAAFTGAQETINLMLKRVGSSATLAAYNAGLESSENGKGFAGAGGTLSTGATFGDTGDLHNVNRGSKTAEVAMAEYVSELRVSVMQALQAATDIPQDLHDKLAGIDFNNISQAAFDAIEKSVYSVIGLQEALVNLPFENLKNLSFSAAEALLAAADGLDTVADNALASLDALLTGYYDNFYSATEKTNLLTSNTTAAFAKLGVTMPAVSDGTRDWYRSLIEALGAQDLSVEANARAYTGALALQGSVSTLANSFDTAARVAEAAARDAEAAAEKIADAMKDALSTALSAATSAADSAYANLEASVEAERTAVQAAYEAASAELDARADKIQTDYDKAVEAQNAQRDAAARTRESMLDGLADERKAAASAYTASSKALSDQQAELAKSYALASDAINASISAAQESLSLIRDLDSALQGAMDFFRQNDDTLLARQTAQDQIAAALVEAQSGKFPTAESIADAIAAVTRPSQQLFASYTDYKRDYYKTAISLDALQKLSGKQLTKEEAQLKALEDTKTAIDTANDRQLAALELQRLALGEANDLLQGIFDARQESIEITYKAVTDASTLELERLKAQYDKDMAAVMADRAALDDGYTQDMKVFDDILANARRQLEVAEGIYATVLTIPDALSALGTAISNLEIERAAQGLPTTPTASSTNPTAAYFLANPDVALAYQKDNYGLTAQQFAETHFALYGQEEQRASPTASTAVADAVAAATTIPATTAAAAAASATTAAASAATTTTTAATTAAAASTTLTATMQAAVANGILDGKSGLARDTSSKSYFDLNSDVAKSFADNNYGMSQKEFSAYHWLHFGQSEGRYFPGFAVGTNYVPRDMIAQIHEGEAIVPKAFNPEAYNKASGNDALVAEIKALREEVKQLREENNASQRSIATSSGKTAKILERVTPDGVSLQITAAV